MISARRIWRGVRKFASGVPIGGERVWSGSRTDLFVAHLSIYQFFSRYVRGKRVLDAGCGLGYGSALLADEGAADVEGVDLDPRAVAYANRKYRREVLRFRVGDCEHLELEAAAFDCIVSSNTLEHLRHPECFIRSAREALPPDGVMVIAVPPNDDPALHEDNRNNPHHHSNLNVRGWIQIFADEGLSVRTFRHTHPAMDELDFSSTSSSRFRAHEFAFDEVSADELAQGPTLTAIFEARTGWGA